MPVIRLFLLITGSRRTFSSFMCRTAFARSSSAGSNGFQRSSHITRRRALRIEAVLGQSFADNVGDRAD